MSIYSDLGEEDLRLIEAARKVLQSNYHPVRHSVGAAVRCPSGRIYTGVNLESCGYGPCAEPIALGAAISNGERDMVAIVAVCKVGDEFPVLSPCGNCRQLLVDYVPECNVIFRDGGTVLKTQAKHLLPSSYSSEFG